MGYVAKLIILSFSLSVLFSQDISADAGSDITLCNTSLSWCDMTTVTLDGSGSTGSNLTYSWDCDSDNISLSATNEVSVSFDIPDAGKTPIDYTCELTVSDGLTQDTDLSLIHI